MFASTSCAPGLCWLPAAALARARCPGTSLLLIWLEAIASERSSCWAMVLTPTVSACGWASRTASCASITAFTASASSENDRSASPAGTYALIRAARRARFGTSASASVEGSRRLGCADLLVRAIESPAPTSRQDRDGQAQAAGLTTSGSSWMTARRRPQSYAEFSGGRYAPVGVRGVVVVADGRDGLRIIIRVAVLNRGGRQAGEE